MLSLNDVTVSFGNWTLLDSISFNISETDKIGLTGKNGAGKTTIMTPLPAALTFLRTTPLATSRR